MFIRLRILYLPKGREIFLGSVCLDIMFFSLENGATWRDHGWLLEENDVPWSEKDMYAMWAPDCVRKDGKYYFFFPAKAENDKAFRRIGVKGSLILLPDLLNGKNHL